MDQYQSFIHKSRYARWLESEGRRETWEETCARYVDFFKEREQLDDESGQEIYDANSRIRSYAFYEMYDDSRRSIET